MKQEGRREEHVISSPANIPGMFNIEDEDSIKVNHLFSTNLPKNYFVVSIYNEGYRACIDLGRMVPLGGIGLSVEEITIVFSVYFGKRIEYCGVLKSDSRDSRYSMPNFQNNFVKYQRLPSNTSNERVDACVKLNRKNVGEITKYFKSNDIKAFLEAGKFYQKALINVDYDVEIAYIDLVRCIELLSKYESPNQPSDKDLGGYLQKIYEKIKDEDDLAKFFIKYHGSTSKFCNTILKYADEDIWNRTESTRSSFCLNNFSTRVQRENVLKNVYQCRSHYIHSGLDMAYHILPNYKGLHEVLNSQPGYSTDKGCPLKVSETLTFLGLERLVRGTLMGYLQSSQCFSKVSVNH